MDSILHYTSVSHAGSLMQGVNKMRVSSDFCDVTVVVGDYRILAHKIILSASSPYFCQMLRLDTRSKTSKLNEIFLNNVDEIAALKIIEFCYTSAISLDDNTVWPLLEAAIKFQLQEICSLCCEFLTAGLDASNCVLSLRLAARLHFPQLEENCVRFMVDNLQKASKSPELISLSPQELSTVLSILEIHGNHIQVIATLTQAWLNWDRKSRIDFVPMLKLLLPKLGDHFQHLVDNGNIASDQDSSGTSAALENRVNAEPDDKTPVDSSSALNSKSTVWNPSCPKSPPTSSQQDSDGKAKDSDLVISSSACENNDALSKGKDFICISCGDEFECRNDLSAHGHLCDESVNKIKNLGEQNMSPMPAMSNQNQSNEASQPNLQDEREGGVSPDVNLVNKSKSNDIKIDGSEENNSVPSERTYPKLRRSPRGHKPDFKPDDFGDKKSSSIQGVLSITDSNESCAEESGSLCNPDLSEGGDLEQSLVEGEENKTEDIQGEWHEKSQMDAPADETKGGIVNRNDDRINEAQREASLSTDDNNNNDSVMQGPTGSFHSSTDSSSNNDVNDSSNAQKSSGNLDQTIVTHNSHGDKITVRDEEAQENKGSFTLKQWREEHQSSPSADKFLDSTPKHKCLICSRGFWERKTLTNHWRQDHGVRPFVAEEEDNSSSDHDFSHVPSKVSKRKCLSPKHAYKSSYKSVSNENDIIVKENCQMDVENKKQGKSFSSQSDTDLNNDCPSDQTEKSCPKLMQVKEEIKDERSYPTFVESLGKNCGKNTNLYQPNSSELEKSQTATKSYENVEHSHSLNPSFENQLRGPYWRQENSDPNQHPSSSMKSSQNADQAANDFFTNYINHYNKLAEWCMAQGTQYCPLCLDYHPVGKQCPKALALNGTHDVPSVNNKNEKGNTDKEPGVKESANKSEEDNEGPLDMTKSSLNFTGGLLTPSSSSSSSKSSSLNSSGIGMLPFLNYGQFMSESDVLDMSTARYGDSKLMPHPPRDIPLSLSKSPLHSDTSFGNSFPNFQLQFSTAPPLSSPAAGPSSSTPNTITSLSGFSKSSNSAKKKAQSRQGFPCTVCNRVFSYQTALFTHMHTHSPSARSYRCQLCNETFARAADLKVHVCPNGMEKPYSCPSCGQTFAKNIHLKRHLATHSGLKPYPCWVCGKRFSRSDHLKRHTQSIHAGARPHVCQVCGKEFVRKYELNKHMQSHEQTFPVP